jgi:hypothetical protein
VNVTSRNIISNAHGIEILEVQSFYVQVNHYRLIPDDTEKSEEVNRNRKDVRDDREKSTEYGKKTVTSKGKFKMWYNKNACNH